MLSNQRLWKTCPKIPRDTPVTQHEAFESPDQGGKAWSPLGGWGETRIISTISPVSQKHLNRAQRLACRGRGGRREAEGTQGAKSLLASDSMGKTTNISWLHGTWTVRNKGSGLSWVGSSTESLIKITLKSI